MILFQKYCTIVVAFFSLSCMGDRTFTNPVDPDVFLDPPSNVSAVALADTAVNIAWSHAGSASGFEIEQRIGTGAFGFIGSVGGTARFFTHTSPLQTAQTYSYRVRALNSGNRSGYAEANAIVVTFMAPTNVVLATVADSAVDVSWAYSGTFQIGFDVERQIGAGTFVSIGSVGAEARVFRDTVGLVDGQQYNYRVRAIGKNNFSQYATSTTLTPTFSAPTAVAAMADSGVAVGWAYTGAMQTRFEVERKIGTGAFTMAGSVASSERSYEDIVALNAGESYTFRVRAISRVNQSQYATSTPFTVTFPAPTSVSVSTVADSAVDLSWNSSATFQTGFEIERSVGGNAFVSISIVGPSVRSWRDRLQLSEGVPCVWRARAIGKNNSSGYGASSTLTPSLAAPTSLSVGVSPTRASLAWTDNSNMERGFIVELSTDSLIYSTVAYASENSTAHVIDGSFNSGTQYYFRVRAYASSLGASSNVAVVRMITDMAFVAGGTFQMGSATGSSDELPIHTVSLTPFFMDQAEVTYEKWTSVRSWGLSHGYADLPTGRNGLFGTTNHPVTQVNWYDIIKWCNARSEMEGMTPAYYTTATQATIYRTGEIDLVNGAVNATASGYRLPTEAEWEFAARGGMQTHSYEYSGSNTVDAVAWYYSNSGDNTHPVKGLVANELALYDMSGNVWEYCWDWYGAYPSTAQTDPQGPSNGTYRILRGGAFSYSYHHHRVAYRIASTTLTGVPSVRQDYYGFRCVRR